MFYCKLGHHHTRSGEKGARVVLETRLVRHVDGHGVGSQIVREVMACAACAAGMTPQAERARIMDELLAPSEAPDAV